MRIISGHWKGRVLSSFDGAHIRPTTDRVKESIFNLCDWDFDGIDVLDLFSGTGNLGLEAISRGASSVTFVDSHRQSQELIKKNIALLKAEEKAHCEISSLDVQKFLKKRVDRPFDVIFIDPPFTEKMAHKVMDWLAGSPVYHSDTTIFIESSRQEQIEDIYEPIVLKKRRSFGDKILSMYNLQRRGEVD